jgi:hypothetical protein
MIFANNHSLTDRLEVIDDMEVEWRSWGEAHGLVKGR